MRFGKRDKSIVDALFLLALFGVFLICALFVVLFGAKIYKNTVKNSETSFNSRTALSYVSEKIRQNDNSQGISIEDTSDGTVVKLSQTVNNRVFNTYLYEYDGYLMEYTTNEGNSLNKKFGSNIMQISGFSVEEKSPSLYKFSVSDADGYNTEFFISVYSDADKSLEDNKGGSDEN